MSVLDILTDAQKSTINHKSLARRLRNVEAKAASNPARFIALLKQSLLRLLEVPKTERCGTNLVKFLCVYCASTQAQNEDDESSPVTCEVIVTMLPYLSAKDKVVRYRATQIVAQLMGVVTEIEDDLYQSVRHELIKRLRDKVPAIRLEAVCALGRLVENEMDEEAQDPENDSDEDEDTYMEEGHESSGLLEKLLDVLQNDTNADVRKALLLNLPIESKTLIYLLERARDKDAATRRALYIKLMPNLGDFRHLSLSMREKLLRWGLRDKDERVRRGAAKMFTNLWIEQIAKTLHRTDADAEEPPKKVIGFHEPNASALLELLERIDILNNGHDEAVGPEAMREFWLARPDYFEAITFDDAFWNDLTPESAFMARTFYEHCSRNKEALAEAEDKLPEVTRFGFHLQKYLQMTLDLHRGIMEEGLDEEEAAEQDFITEQLLHIAHTLDYTDEIGRRKMFSLLRNALSMSALPDEITRLTIEALRLTCTPDLAGEKEFIAVVVEALAEVHDVLHNSEDEDDRSREASPDEGDSFVSAHSELSQNSQRTATNTQSKKKAKMTPEEQEQADYKETIVTLKCLHIMHVMLENISYSTFSTNIELETKLNTLIIPAARSHEVHIREAGLECLGLACLLSPQLAKDNWDTFVYCLERGHDALQILCLKILCDLCMAHKQVPTTDRQVDDADKLDISAFTMAFESSNEVQLIATTSLGKLMMCGFYKGDNVNVFDEAIEEAEKTGAKGADMLGKVKATMKAQEEVENQLEGRTSLGNEGSRRDS